MAKPTYVNSKEGTVRFSRALLARSLIPTGLNFHDAHYIAEKIRNEVKQKNITEIDSQEIVKLVKKELKEINPELEKRYSVWRELKYTRPLIILIGGGTGVGTSTISTELANLLNITKVIGTDSIREVMRSTIPKNIAPDMHMSTYNVWKLYKCIPSKKTSVLHGYYTQVRKISFGINAMINRALRENESIIIEGVHIFPGLFEKHENTFEYFLDITDEKLHKSRFYRREGLNSLRPASKYLKYFKEIRAIRKFIINEVKKKKISVIEATEVQETLDKLIKQLQIDFKKRKNMNRKSL
jgi:2-phosphoglycerate kinase